MLTFRAMGTTVSILVVGGGADLLERGRQRIEDLERRWSRFRDDSEISALNASGGDPVVVSDETFALIWFALRGWRATAGRFDPTLLGAVIAAGYDRSFDLLDQPQRRAAPFRSGAGDIELDETVRSVRLPGGVGFDPGGIGKGLAADIVASELLAQGARGACVNVGGDLRAEGTPPVGEDWLIGIEDPATHEQVATLTLQGGAVATTSRAKRAWRTTAGDAHHLIDPATQLPAATPLASVSVVAGEAWWAEVVAKAAFIAGPADAPEQIRSLDCSGLLVAEDGTLTPVAHRKDAA